MLISSTFRHFCMSTDFERAQLWSCDRIPPRFVWLDHEGQRQLSFRSSDHMFTDVVGQTFTARLFSRSSGFTKHWYTFHSKAQIKSFLSSVTIQIIFTDYGAEKCDTLTCALWGKQVMQCFDSSVLWVCLSQTAVWFTRRISVCKCIRI